MAQSSFFSGEEAAIAKILFLGGGKRRGSLI